MKRNGIFVVIGLLLMSVLIVSCGSDSDPLGIGSDCSVNNTATVAFKNSSTTGKNYDIIWDGSKIVSNLTPGNTSAASTVTAGVTHTVEFKVAGTSTLACSTAYPNYVECTNHTLSCSN